jgi:hypothetical protein
MRFFDRTENPNAIVGLFMLLLLAILAGPGTLPRLISSVPSFDEGVPCDWLRTGEDRAHHQSLLSRTLGARQDPPIDLEVRTGSLPQTQEGDLTITIVVTNKTLAPVPILVTSGELILDLTLTRSGFGMVFDTTTQIQNIPDDLSAGGYTEDRIRILGPRQVCIHRVSVPFDQIPASSALIANNTGIRAFYRNASPGEIPLLDPNQPFTDQGLWVGVVESSPYTISAATAQ